MTIVNYRHLVGGASNVLLIARKNLLSERTRLLISVGGVALSVVLISLLLSLYRGWSEKVGGFVDEVDADLWIAQEGTTDFISAGSVLPLEEGTTLLGSHPLVKSGAITIFRPLIVRPRTVTSGGKSMDVELIGYDVETGMGGPLKIVDGKSKPAPGEVIIDKAMTKYYGVDIGDTLTVSNNKLKVVGRSSGGDFIAFQTIFVPLDEAQEILGLKQGNQSFVTFFLLKLKNPENRDELEKAMDQFDPRIEAITSDDFSSATRDRILNQVIPILGVVLMLAFIVGLAVAGLTIYTATVEKAREYGILKAVGFSNGYLYRLVFEQSLVTGILGFVIGVGITLIVGRFAQDIVRQFVVFTRWQDVLFVAGVTLVMALLAAYVPVRRLAAIDPVSVFKA